jgi:hypothetical protein
VLSGPAPVLALQGRGIGQFGANAHQVASDRLIHGAGRFNRYVKIEILEPLRKLHNVLLDHGLAARDDYMLRPVPAHIGQDIAQRKIVTFGFPGCVGRIAPGTSQIASAGA